MVIREDLAKLGFENVDEVMLYMFALQHGIERKFNITINDLAIIKKHKLIKRNYSTGGFDTIFGKSEVLNEAVQKVEEYIDQYRKIFQDTGVPGKMGDKNSCIKKLTKWLKSNPNATMQGVLNTAKYYCENYRNITTYLQQADYFIYKDDQSRLSALYDEAHHRKSEQSYGNKIV